MSAARGRRRGLRRAVVAMVAGVAFAGATLVGATSATAAGDQPDSCMTTSTASLLAAGSVGLLDCITGDSTASRHGAAEVQGDATATAPSTPEPLPAPSASAEPTTAPVERAVQAPASASAPVPAARGELRSVRVITSTTTVYPSAKGYDRSTVRFSIKGLTAARTGVRISGSAVLRKGARVVRTWKLDATTTTLTWDGRNGSKVDPGRYVLTATAWSTDGSRAMSTMRVRVSAKHLVTRTASIRTPDLAKARTHNLPVAVIKAFEYGTVTYRVHTVAKVTGTARVVISGPSGERVVVPLLSGAHVTAAAVLPQSFTSATFQHQWKKGAAKLTELYTVFTFKQLV